MTFIFWLQFATVCIAGAMSPGPSLALIIRNSSRFNRFAGIIAAIGHGLGMGVYAIFAVTGLSFILSNNIYIFNSIQIAGIILLFFFGLSFVMQKEKGLNDNNEHQNFNSFMQGFAISILNPKILIWFSAVFSQFVFIDSNLFINTVLVVTAAGIDCLWYILVAIIVTSYGLKDFFQNRINIIQKISGFVLILISILLIFNLFNN